MKLNNPYITKRTETLYKLHYKLQKTYERLGKAYYTATINGTFSNSIDIIKNMIDNIEDIIKAIGRISKEIQEEDRLKNEFNDTL
jgi:acyl-CoA reductase-like NAD-dependent aldehyde dehydrogenase